MSRFLLVETGVHECAHRGGELVVKLRRDNNAGALGIAISGAVHPVFLAPAQDMATGLPNLSPNVSPSHVSSVKGDCHLVHEADVVRAATCKQPMCSVFLVMVSLYSLVAVDAVRKDQSKCRQCGPRGFGMSGPIHQVCAPVCGSPARQLK